MVRTAPGASFKVANVLIYVTHLVTAHCTTDPLDKDTTASSWGTAIKIDGKRWV